MSEDRMRVVADILDTLRIAEKLKCELRHSWLSDGRQESVAEHCYQMALMAIFSAPYLDKELDLCKALKMVLVHDLVEAVVGDIPFFEESDRKAKKAEREQDGIEKLRAMLPSLLGDEVRSLWCEFEAGDSREAKFVRALDNLEVQLQHNLASLDTWLPIEHELLFTKMDRHCEHDSFLKQVCDAVKKEGELKLQGGGVSLDETRKRIAS